MRILKYQPYADTTTESGIEHRVQQLVLIAKALATEVETLQAELSDDRHHSKLIDLDNGIDFYEEVERYEIELLKSALDACGGNQTQAAKLLRMKSTTLNAKMKHYGLNPVRAFTLQRANAQPST